ncbi:hypothetical protein [uncultured Cloacibacillus sp.]|uniref:LPD3 domain-containing protein n=1 Tax=uncultured Cloacibacillus sp. TaxID=889794 RepID=UPI0026DB6652|nr:hypothetical protein [uncultured Cloacibacillus sp.]
MGIYDEVRSRTGSGVMVGPALSADEAHALGLSSVNPLVDELERSYERYVTENPEESAARIWNAERVGVPLWVQERSEKYADEAKKRLALLEKGTPDWKRLADASPVTASFMTGDGVMASAYDDVQALADIEDVTHSLSYLRLNYKDKLAYLRSERLAPRLSVPALDVKDRPGMIASLPVMNPRAIGRDFDITISADELARLRDKPVAQMVSETLTELDRWAADTSFGRGMSSGYEMSAIATEAYNQFLSNSFGTPADEAKWVELEKRVLALDRGKPEGWLSGMLYETGKFIGQQAGGAWTTGLMSTAGAGLGAYAGSLGAAAVGGSMLTPVGGAILAGAAFGWWLGTKAGVFTQAAKTEMGLDLIDRRMMKGADGEYISDFAAGLGSLAVGAVNGALELTEWTVAGRPFTGVARRVVPPQTMASLSRNIASRLSALPSLGKYGQAARYWGSNVFSESMTEVFQELVPITIDEMQKHALLDGYNARRLGDVTAELTETFMSSLYSFALISAVGPVAGLAAGRFNGELTRREFEAAQTKLFNMKMDNFKEHIGASKILKRFPSMSREHREAVLAGADLSRAYIGAEKVETLFQQGLLPGSEEYANASSWAQDYLGVTEDEYNESMQTGYEMELAAAKLFDAVESAEESKTGAIYDALAKDIRFARDGMTLTEAEEADISIREILRKDLFGIGVKKKEETEEAASARRVYEASRMQMEAEGVDAETAAADSYIRAMASHRLARMYNSALNEEARGGKILLAEDIERMFPIVIEKDGAGKVTGLTFQQTAGTSDAGSVRNAPSLYAQGDADTTDIIAGRTAASGRTYHQPLNDGVDLKAKVDIIMSHRRFTNDSAMAVRNGEERKKFVSELVGSYDNALTGWNIKLSQSGVKHSISSAIKNKNIDYETSIEIVAELPAIIKHAVLIESHDDRKNASNVGKIHRMFAPVSFNDGNDIYVVMLTVKELDGTFDTTVDGVYKAHDARGVKKISDAKPKLPAQEGHPERNAPDIYKISIEEMLKSVNDNAGVPYIQPSRGSITFPQYEGAPVIIRLGKDADRSTFVHEFAHLYFWHLRNLASLDTVQNKATWDGPEAEWNRDLKVVSRWWEENAEDIARQAAQFVPDSERGGLSAEGFRAWLASGMERKSAAGAAYDRAAQEYFARGFERYLMEGKAPVPSRELLAVFRRFKKWLCDIYRTLTELDVELSDEVRGVFGRMVATDEAVEQLRASRMADDMIAGRAGRDDADETDEANAAFAPTREPEPEYDIAYDPYEDAKENVLGILFSEDTPERRREMAERAEEIRPQVLRAVLAEPGYKALAMMEQEAELRLNPEAVMDMFSETVLSAMPEGSLAADGMTDLETAARSLNFNSAKEMIDAIAGRRSIKEEVDARVRGIVAREFTDTFSSPAAMDAAAEAALYDNEEHGERLAAETEASFDEALELAAREEEAEAEFRAIFESDEAARVENEDPASRTNVVKWMRAHGRPRYSYVVREIGQEDAQALLKRYGPSFFSKEGRGLDDIAQELDGMGIHVGGEAGLFNLLMSEAVPESPLGLAREEGRREVMDEYRERYKKHVAGQERRAARNAERIKRIEAKAEEKTGKAKARYKAAAERLKSQMQENHDKAVALRKEIRARYQKRKTELEEKYKAMDERRRASFIEQKNKDWTRRALNRYLSGFRTHIEKSVSRKGLHDAAKTAARNQVAGMTVQQLYDVTGWVRVEKDSRAAADRALRNFDEKAFREARRKEFYAHEMIRAMYRARRNVEYMRSRMAKYAKRKQKQTFGMDPRFLYQLDMLLTRFDFTKRTKKEVEALTRKDILQEAKSLSDFIKEQAEAGVPLLMPEWIAQSITQMKYEGLFVHQLESAFKAVQNIMQAGRDEKKTIARQKNIELAGITAEVLERAQKYFGKDKIDGDTHIEVARKDPNAAADVLLDLNTIEAMCRGLDGFEDDGPMQDYFFRPVREAVSREYAELNRMFGEFRNLKLRVYGTDFKADMKPKDIGVCEYKRVTDAETGKVFHVPTEKMSLFTQENIICAALNMGNADNLARLKDGWGWTDADIEKIKAKMSRKDWEYVQGVWDLLDTMWPKIKKVHELMTGTTIEKVEAKPVITEHGIYRGGYYPIVTDLRYSETAAAQNERQEIMASAPCNFLDKHTKSGHRKARAENVLGRPPLLSFSVLDNHVANVIHDYEMAPVIRDAWKILRRDTIKSVITTVYGDRGYRNFGKWLNDIAANTKNNGVASGSDSGGRIVNGIKSKTAMFALGGNIGGALMQPLGYFALAHRIGFVNTALAIAEGLNPNTRTYAFAREKSAFMREQMDDGNSEVRKLRQNWTTNDHGISRAADFFLSVYPLFQNMCNVPGWVQCYKIGLKRYGDEAKAVAYADSVIRQTQSASTIADLSTFERSGPIGQLTTMFYSWFRVMYQMQNEAIMRVKYEHGINRVKDLASYAFYILVAQSVAEALLRGGGPEPEDDESRMWSWAKWTTQRVVLSPLSTVPLVREIGSAIDNNFKFGVKFTPAQGGLDALARLLNIAIRQGGNALSGEDIEWGDIAEGAATVAGYRYGVPNRKMIQAAKAFWAYFNEEEAIPWAYLVMGGGYKPKDE